MKKNVLLCLISLPITITTMNFDPQSPLIPITHRAQLVEPLSTKNSPNQHISDLHERLEKQQQQRLLISSSIALGVVGIGAGTFLIMHQQSQPKRFVGEIATGVSLTSNILQLGAGVTTAAYVIYKVRSWLYEGYIKEKEFNKELLALKAQINMQHTALATAVNNNAMLLDALTRSHNQCTETVNAHAQDLNAGRTLAQQTAKTLASHAFAINNLLKCDNQKVARLNENPVNLPQGITTPAATLQEQPLSPAQEIFIESEDQKTCFPCCCKNSATIKYRK